MFCTHVSLLQQAGVLKACVLPVLCDVLTTGATHTVTCRTHVFTFTFVVFPSPRPKYKCKKLRLHMRCCAQELLGTHGGVAHMGRDFMWHSGPSVSFAEHAYPPSCAHVSTITNAHVCTHGGPWKPAQKQRYFWIQLWALTAESRRRWTQRAVKNRLTHKRLTHYPQKVITSVACTTITQQS